MGHIPGIADFTLGTEGDGRVRLSFAGPMRISSMGLLDRRLRNLTEPIDEIGLHHVQDIDTVGAWTALRLSRELCAPIVGASNDAQRLIDAIGEAKNTVSSEAGQANTLYRSVNGVGDGVVGMAASSGRAVKFFGSVVAAGGALIRRPGRFRGKALVHQMELVGVSALGLIGIMSFLIGIVIAQQGAAQLQQFGAELYTVNLVGRLCVRELGVLMTAIMVAGRSGSAFAAQIGTMKLTEEVDAMRTIGVSPVESLIVPRILASVVMMPLLAFYSAVMAIIGGAFLASVALGIGFFEFLTRIREVVPISDVWVCLVKAPVFGLVIGLTGCHHGMQVRNNSEEVGLRTTAAVVSAIFAVIVLDAFFAIFFTKIGWA